MRAITLLHEDNISQSRHYTSTVGRATIQHRPKQGFCLQCQRYSSPPPTIIIILSSQNAILMAYPCKATTADESKSYKMSQRVKNLSRFHNIVCRRKAGRKRAYPQNLPSHRVVTIAIADPRQQSSMTRTSPFRPPFHHRGKIIGSVLLFIQRSDCFIHNPPAFRFVQ